MRRRLTKLAAALAALAALAIGGSALASASGGDSKPAKSPAVIQQGSAKAGAVANQPAEPADTDAFEDENGTRWARVPEHQRTRLGDYTFTDEDGDDSTDIEQMLMWDVRPVSTVESEDDEG